MTQWYLGGLGGNPPREGVWGYPPKRPPEKRKLSATRVAGKFGRLKKEQGGKKVPSTMAFWKFEWGCHRVAGKFGRLKKDTVVSKQQRDDQHAQIVSLTTFRKQF